MLTAMDSAGNLLDDVTLWVRFDGADSSDDSCEVVLGRCDVSGPTVDEKGAAFTIVVQAASAKGTPTGAFFATDALEVLIQAVGDNKQAADAMPAFYLSDGVDKLLGDVPEQYLAVNSGTGLLSSPMGVVFSPSAMPRAMKTKRVKLDLDGTGLLSSPMGFTPASMFLAAGGSRLAMATPRYSAEPVTLRSGSIVGASIARTGLHRTLLDGGWVSKTGGPAASHVVESGVASPESTEGSSHDARMVEAE